MNFDEDLIEKFHILNFVFCFVLRNRECKERIKEEERKEGGMETGRKEGGREEKGGNRERDQRREK